MQNKHTHRASDTARALPTESNADLVIIVSFNFYKVLIVTLLAFYCVRRLNNRQMQYLLTQSRKLIPMLLNVGIL